MNIFVDKEAAMAHFIEHYVENRWMDDVLRIDAAYKQQQEQIDEALFAAFREICTRAFELQEQGEKGEIKYIFISYLRTSLIENRICYRIDAHDERWFRDPADCVSYWKPDFIFEPLFQRMKALEAKKMEYGRKVTTMDIEELKLIEADHYHTLAVEFVRSHIEQLMAEEAFLHMDKAPNLTLTMGEFRDHTELLAVYDGAVHVVEMESE